jgi:hypothetical protein
MISFSLRVERTVAPLPVSVNIHLPTKANPRSGLFKPHAPQVAAGTKDIVSVYVDQKGCSRLAGNGDAQNHLRQNSRLLLGGLPYMSGH